MRRRGWIQGFCERMLVSLITPPMLLALALVICLRRLQKAILR